MNRNERAKLVAGIAEDLLSVSRKEAQLRELEARETEERRAISGPGTRLILHPVYDNTGTHLCLQCGYGGYGLDVEHLIGLRLIVKEFSAATSCLILEVEGEANARPDESTESGTGPGCRPATEVPDGPEGIDPTEQAS